MKTAHELVLDAKKHINEISIDQAVQLIKEADLLIDVREADEYLSGHIPGAVNFSRGMLEFKLSSQEIYKNPNLNIVLYCKTSGRSALCAAAIKSMGYKNVSSILGGMDEWVAAGKPIEQPKTTSFE